MNTIYLENPVQVALYENELKGQMSDGNWENSSPRDHWKVMCDAKAKVADEDNPVGINFRPRRRYNYASKFLIECVGDRMMMYARATIKFPHLSKKAIGILDYGSWIFEGRSFEIYKDAIKELGVNNAEELKALRDSLNDVPYTLKNLRKDLLAINKAVNRN